MYSVLVIAAGGALGTISRHGLNIAASQWLQLSFPYGTLAVNILGSFLMGLIMAFYACFTELPQELKLFFTVGFLGAFTTFSTFSLDAMNLYLKNDFTGFALYVVASVILSLGALALGAHLVWKMS